MNNPLFDGQAGSLFSAPPPVRQRRRLEPLPAEREQTLLHELATQTGQFIENAQMVLDTPAAIARGIMAGEPLSGFTWGDTRISGAELLEKAGIAPENKYIKALAGFGTEVVTDPLFWLTGGTRALSAAGAAADAAGLLKSAPVAYMSKFGTEAAEATGRGKYITSLFDANDIPRTAGNFKAVSPVGQRVAQSKVTLADVVENAADPADALQRVLDKVGSQEAYEAIKDQTLGGLLGINVGGLNVAFSPPGTDAALDALDKVGAMVRFSYPGRLGTAISSKAVDGATDVGGQITALRANVLQQEAERLGRAAATDHALLLSKISLSDNSKALLGADSLFSPQGNDMLTRLAENKGNANDLRILADTPGLDGWLANWDALRTQQFNERRALGLKGGRYSDRFGTEYTPRYGDELDFEDMAKGKGRALYTAAETETYGRRRHMMTPGGTDDLRKISMLPEVVALSQPGSQMTPERAGEAILNWFRQNHPAEPIELAQTTAIARSLSRRRADLPDGTPVFAAHPANAQSRRILSHAVATGRANFLLETLAEAAQQAGRNTQVGRWRNLAQSFGEIAGKTGFQTAGGNAAKSAANALRAKMSQVLNVDPRSIDLAQFSVPERVVRRLEKMADFYSTSTAQQELTNYLDGWTRLFKSFVLATPRRFVRDAYSNATSIFLETGSGLGTLRGMWAANHIANGNYAAAMPVLRTIPRYAGLSDDAIRDAFARDVGTHGVLSGLQSSELLSHSRSGEIGQMVPGSTPVSIGRGIKELIPDGSRSPTQMVGDFAQPFVDFATNNVQRYEQRNPMLRASSTINDAVDSMGRMGGFIALLKQGVAPAEAADRIRKSLVDYQSLTLTERRWLRAIFPWYSYMSRQGAYVAESLYNRPGGNYSQMLRASNTLQQGDGDDYIPANLRKQFAVRLPDEITRPLGLYQPDVTTYLKDIDLPGVDILNMIDPGSVTGTLKNVGAVTSPPIQALMSMMTGRDLFTDRPLTESVTPQDRIYKALTGDPQGLSPLTKTLVGLAPGLQTPIAIGGALADDRIEDFDRRLAKALLNYASGVKIADVDERYLIEDLQQKIGEALKSKTRTLSRQFVPDELLPTLTPRELELNQLSKWLAKRSQELRQQREAQGP